MIVVMITLKQEKKERSYQYLHANALKKKYEVRGIPYLVIVSPNGKTITKNGRNDVSSNAKGAIKDWKKKS